MKEIDNHLVVIERLCFINTSRAFQSKEIKKR